VFQGGAISSAVAQHFKGNDAALGDLVQAEAAGSAAALANLTQNVTNGGLAYLDKSRTGRPLTSIDLDADRDKDRTWLVGGGAQGQTRGGTEIAAAGHVRVGDRGLMGVDAAGTFQDWGGKAGWTEDRRGEDTFFGGAEYGRESRRTGHGGTIEIEGEHNIAQNKTTVKGSAGHTYHSGQTIKVDGAASIDRGAEQDNVTSGR
jgi:hypothetical protein